MMFLCLGTREHCTRAGTSQAMLGAAVCFAGQRGRAPGCAGSAPAGPGGTRWSCEDHQQPEAGLWYLCGPRQSHGLGLQNGVRRGAHLPAVPSLTTGGEGHSGWAADPGKEGQCCGKLVRPVISSPPLWSPWAPALTPPPPHTYL